MCRGTCRVQCWPLRVQCWPLPLRLLILLTASTPCPQHPFIFPCSNARLNAKIDSKAGTVVMQTQVRMQHGLHPPGLQVAACDSCWFGNGPPRPIACSLLAASPPTHLSPPTAHRHPSPQQTLSAYEQLLERARGLGLRTLDLSNAVFGAMRA